MLWKKNVRNNSVLSEKEWKCCSDRSRIYLLHVQNMQHLIQGITYAANVKLHLVGEMYVY